MVAGCRYFFICPRANNRYRLHGLQRMMTTLNAYERSLREVARSDRKGLETETEAIRQRGYLKVVESTEMTNQQVESADKTFATQRTTPAQTRELVRFLEKRAESEWATVESPRATQPYSACAQCRLSWSLGNRPDSA